MINESLGPMQATRCFGNAARLKNLWPDPHNVARIAADCFTAFWR